MHTEDEAINMQIKSNNTTMHQRTLRRQTRRHVVESNNGNAIRSVDNLSRRGKLAIPTGFRRKINNDGSVFHGLASSEYTATPEMEKCSE